MDPLRITLLLLVVQAALGAFDTLVNHEWRARLAARTHAAQELRLHALRSALYGLIFGALAWYEWHAAWALVPLTLIILEIGVTAVDTVIEYRLRHVDALERLTHLALLLNTGAYSTTLLATIVLDWWNQPPGVLLAQHGVMSWLLSLGAAAALTSSLRDVIAATRLSAARVVL